MEGGAEDSGADVPMADKETLEKRKEVTGSKLKDAIARQNYLQLHFERAGSLMKRVEDS